MELCLITPVHHLEYTSLLSGRFCIAPVALHYAEYMDYFAEASNAGYEVILDNGVFENDLVEDKEFVALANSINAKRIIIPDQIGKSTLLNYTSAVEWKDQHQADLPNDCELMHVLQCAPGDYEGFKATLMRIIQERKFEWLGICRDAMYNAFGQFTHTKDQEINRLFFSSWLQMEAIAWVGEPSDTGLSTVDSFLDVARAKDIKWHFLGMGPNVHLIENFWFVDCMDTATLFTQSAHGLLATNGRFEQEFKRPKDYFRRDWSILDETVWSDTLVTNCEIAVNYANKATQRRLEIDATRL